ncbi:MAG: phosphatidylserine/phosphatidylglycerophosphate/cardiolipin synthase family protein [Polyangiaceae bacterium]
MSRRFLVPLLFAVVVALVPLAGCAPASPSVAEEDLTTAPLAACASPLMKSIYARAAIHAKKGNVPPKFFASARNTASTKPLLRGPEIFPSIASLIEGASKEVDMQFYVFRADNDPARDILGALKRLERRRKTANAREPVTVRLLFSALSVLGMKTKPVREIMAQVEQLELDPRYVRFELALYVHGGMGNLHSKTVVVDGRAAIITGANVQEQHNDEAPWHDTGYILSGEVAEGLLAEFDDAWRQAAKWTCDSKGSDLATCSSATQLPTRLPSSNGLPNTCVPMLITGRPGDGWPFANGNDNTQDQAFLAGIESARERIRIHTPNLNDDSLKEALVLALDRNRSLRIDIVLSKGFNDSAENLPTLGGTNEQTVEWLYGAIAERLPGEGPCARLRVHWYSDDGTNALVGNGAKASHAKYFSIDGQVAIVGSANMDNLAWNHSREVNVVVDSRSVTESWDEKVFASSFDRGIDACTR